MDTVLMDLRYGLRGLRRNPVFALTAIAALALGTGATTAVFSVVDRILFRPLPYGNEDRLVSVGMLAPLDTNEFFFADAYTDLKRNPGPFEAVTAFEAGSISCDLTEQNPLRLACLRVAGNFLDTFGLTPIAGRNFTREEDLPNGPKVVMISYGLWRSRFAGDSGVIGKTIPIDGVAWTIIGVLPKSFEMPTLTHGDILMPLGLNEGTERQGRAFRVFARLKPGIDARQAFAQMQPAFERMMETVPKQFRKEIGFRVQAVRDRQVGNVRVASWTLFGAVLAVLLIACANVTNLLLARAVAREREFTMRAALGASRLRLARQSLIESMVLGVAGGAAGCALAFGLLRVFVAIAPAALPRLDEAAIDGRVLLFAVLVSFATAMVFGLAPALRSPDAAAIGGWRSGGSRSGALRSALVALQIGMSIVLLTGAGLLARSLWKLQSVPLGMQSDHVLTARIVLAKQRYGSDAPMLAFFSALEQKLAALPGVDAAAITDSLPPSGGTRGRPLSSIGVEGQPRRPEGTGGMVAWRYVTPGYFRALGIPIRRGRGFNEQDRDANAYSVILSERLARQLFGNEDPIGRHALQTPREKWFTVIGVAGDVRNRGAARNAEPEYYVVRKPAADETFHNQEPPTGWREAAVAVRTPLNAGLMAKSVRSAIESLDATLPVQMETMTERLDGVTQGPRFNAMLLGVFAGVGVFLAAIGLFGVMSFLVAQRTREIGVRMALGATPGRILRWALGHAGRWTVAGLAAGAVGSIGVSRLLRSLLFGVEPGDPLALGVAAVVLAGVAVVAAGGPAIRAARVDPVESLRED